MPGKVRGQSLADIIHSSTCVFCRGRACEIVRLWNYLNEEKKTIAQEYANSLKQAESTASSGRGKDVTMGDIAKMYQSFGRFLKDLGLMEEVGVV